MTRLTTWAAGSEALHGAWCLLGPEAANVLAPRFDWVGIDAQHGLFDASSMVRALQLMPRERCDVLVRVPANDDAWIGRALDAGARGVIVPMVDTPQDAERAVRACRYPPDGRRSWGQFTEHWAREEVPASVSDVQTVCAVMIETATGMGNAEAITAVPGVDMVFVGPFDLSLGLGQPLQETLDAGADGPLGAIVSACHRNDVVPGAFAGSVERAQLLAGLGYRVLAVVTDAGLLNSGSDAALERLDELGVRN